MKRIVLIAALALAALSLGTLRVRADGVGVNDIGRYRPLEGNVLGVLDTWTGTVSYTDPADTKHVVSIDFPAARVSVVAFHGTADRHVPFEGGAPTMSIDRHKRIDRSVAYAIDFWKRRDACDAQPSRRRKGSVVHDAYACADGTAVELYAIEGQGHAWPGGEKGLRNGNVDAPTMEISATGLMWDFFARHPKK